MFTIVLILGIIAILTHTSIVFSATFRKALDFTLSYVGLLLNEISQSLTYN